MALHDTTGNLDMATECHSSLCDLRWPNLVVTESGGGRIWWPGLVVAESGGNLPEAVTDGDVDGDYY